MKTAGTACYWQLAFDVNLAPSREMVRHPCYIKQHPTFSYTETNRLPSFDKEIKI
jgi:hypothetical protein